MPNSELVSAACAAGLQARVAALLDDATLKKIAAAIQAAQPAPDAAAMGGVGGLMKKAPTSKTYMSETAFRRAALEGIRRAMVSKFGESNKPLTVDQLEEKFLQRCQAVRGYSLREFQLSMTKSLPTK